MMPKTEKELEIYFKLKDLEESRAMRHIVPYGIGSNIYPKDRYEKEYQRKKAEYLKIANE